MNYQKTFLFAMCCLFHLVGIESMIHRLLLLDKVLRVSNNLYDLLNSLHTVDFRQRLQDHNLYEVLDVLHHMIGLL